MFSDSGYPVAWVESPLQFVAAAEVAAQRRRPMRVVFRLGPHMSATAAELLARGADFASCTPYVGIPWGELRRAPEWVIGDGLSGQFRFAAAILRPRAVTLLDDGMMSLHLAAGIAGLAPFERPGRSALGLRAVLGGLTRDHLLRLAGTDALEFASVFGAERPEFAALSALGVTLRQNSFAWTRRTARPPILPSHRVVLGTARVADGLLSLDAHLADVAKVARDGALVYLPHRRELSSQVEAVRGIPGVAVLEPGLPVELFLAGLSGLELHSSGSTADLTLARVLESAELAG